MSDIHLEYRRALVDIPVISKNLVLAGDIGDPFKDNYREFLVKCSDDYEDTFIIPGNHEYWGSDMDRTDDQIDLVVNRFNNVHLLKNAVVEADNITFIGCTLWSKILKEPVNRRGDEHNIMIDGRNVTWNDLNRLHSDDVQWLTTALQKYNSKRTVVVTHHIPTYKLLHPYYDVPKYKNDHDRFYTDLEHLIKPPIKVWIAGHSHCVMGIELNGVSLQINSVGYPTENEHLSDKARSISLKT
jgi:predicted phosphohydrolase